MYYTTEIYDPEEGLNIIALAVAKFNPERFLYAIEYKKCDEVELELMACSVADCRVKLEAEYTKLLNFSREFNKEFVTVNNKCFNTALTLFYKMRSGISETKKLFMKFCPRARREDVRHVIGNMPVSAYDYSYISANIYPLPLFKFETYPPCVSGLYNEIEKFFILFAQCVNLCKSVLAEEEKIRKDKRYCYFLFKNFKDKVIKEIAGMISLFNKDSEDLSEKANSAIASRNKYDNDEAWSPFGFHNFDKNDVKLLVIKQVIDVESATGLSKTEILLFGNDKEKVERVKHLISIFDDLLPDGYNKKKLPAKTVLMFLHYFGFGKGLLKEAVKYFFEKYMENTSAKYESVSYEAVISYNKEVKNDRKGEFKAFVEKLKTRCCTIQILEKASNF